MEKRQWQQASVTDESKNEDLYPKLFENPNAIRVSGKLRPVEYNDTTSLPFATYENKMWVGEPADTHNDLYYLAYRRYGVPTDETRTKYSGRIFTDYKIITFWVFPENKDILKSVLKDIAEVVNNNYDFTYDNIKLDFSDPDWKIEIPASDETGNIYNLEEINSKKDVDWGSWEPTNDDVKYISIEDYHGGHELSGAELAQQHVLSPMLKKKREVPYGYGSKNPKYQEKRQWQQASVTDENFTEKNYPRLFENPDSIFINKEDLVLKFSDDDAYAFGYYKNKMYVDDRAHWAIVPRLFTLKRKDFKYAGRLWVNEKIISFWEYPETYEKLLSVLKDIEKATENLKILRDLDKWRIELPGIKDSDDWYTDYEEVIPITEYTGDVEERSKEELELPHLLPPAAGKKKVPYGYGSKNPKYQGKRQWQQASVTDESKTEQHYPRLFESPDQLDIRDINGVRYNYENDYAYPFGYYHDRLYIGNPGTVHGIIAGKDNILLRTDFTYSGRLWTKIKVISFWKYPETYDDLLKILQDIERVAKKRFNADRYPINPYADRKNWKIEIRSEGDYKYIPIEEYKRSEKTPDNIMAIPHLIPPATGKKNVPAGYGSKNPKYQEKRRWQQASVTDENKEEQFYSRLSEKFTEDSDPVKDLGVGMPAEGDIIIANNDVYLLAYEELNDNRSFLVSDEETNVRMRKNSTWRVLDTTYYEDCIIPGKASDPGKSVKLTDIMMKVCPSDNLADKQFNNILLTYKQLKKYFKII
jgi:hypothetical protein